MGDGLSVEGVSRFIIGGETNSNCDLTIHPTLAQDEGRYQCQVSGDYGASPIISQPVIMTVNSEPGQPYIVEGREEGMVKIEQGEDRQQRYNGGMKSQEGELFLM